jgi:hypothetical protein
MGGYLFAPAWPVGLLLLLLVMVHVPRITLQRSVSHQHDGNDASLLPVESEVDR